MTPASVKNLSEYLFDDRENKRMRTAKKEKEQAAQEKKQIANVAFQIHKITNSGLDQETKVKQIGAIEEQYKDNLDVLQLAMGSVKALKNSGIAAEDRQFMLSKRQAGEDALQEAKNYETFKYDRLTGSPTAAPSPKAQYLFGEEQAAKKQAAEKNITELLYTQSKTNKNNRQDSAEKTFQTKIKSLMEAYPSLSLPDATGMINGTIKTTTNPIDGTQSLVNLVTKEQTPFNLPKKEPIEQTPIPQDQKLWNLADLVSGPIPAIREKGSVLTGMVGLPVAGKTEQAMVAVEASKNSLIRALSLNPKMPVAEIKRIGEEIDIGGKVLDNPKLYRNRLISLEKSMKIKRESQKAIYNNPNMPPKDRKAALKSANDIDNFIRRLGIPIQVNDTTGYEKLESGTTYRDPSGKIRIKK